MLEKLTEKIESIVEKIERWLHPFITKKDTHRIKNTHEVGVSAVTKNADQTFFEQSKRAFPNLVGTVFWSTVLWGAVIGLSKLATNHLSKNTNFITPAFNLPTVIEFLKKVTNNEVLKSTNWVKDNKLKLAMYIGIVGELINLASFIINSSCKNKPNHYLKAEGQSPIRDLNGEFLPQSLINDFLKEMEITINRKATRQPAAEGVIDREMMLVDFRLRRKILEGAEAAKNSNMEYVSKEELQMLRSKANKGEVYEQKPGHNSSTAAPSRTAEVTSAIPAQSTSTEAQSK